MKRLNIFIDETGEFGFERGSAKLYGVSLVFHEHRNSIKSELKILNAKFKNLNFSGAVHMGELVTGHGTFRGMTIAERRKIYTTFYKFSRQIDAKYHTIIIDKQHANESSTLSRAIRKELQSLIMENLAYFQSFDEIKAYYDGGQAPLNKIINQTFGALGGYEQIVGFDHVEKKLFQVADMLTYVDKLIYKYERGIKFTKTEAGFFRDKSIKTTIQELSRHRFK